jgi:DNA-binding NarL/FixJ family response regulator
LKRVRIVLDYMPRMLRTIVRDIVSRDPRCEIVAETSKRSLPAQLKVTPADVIILAVTDSGHKPERFASLFARHPATRVIAITSGGNRAYLHALRPHVTLINELSSASLLSAIRQAPAEFQRRA